MNVKIVAYWTSTGLLSLGLLAGGFADISHAAPILEGFQHLGYPIYLATLLGFWKLMAVPALLTPGFLLLKEWAYAGVFFNLSGAFFSHLAANDPLSGTIPIFILGTLLVSSWWTRPQERTLRRVS